MFERVYRSWELAISSWKILQANRDFFIFPVRSMLSIILITLIFVFPIIYFDLMNWLFSGRLIGAITSFIILLVYGFVSYTVILYFNTALACAVLVLMRGGVPTLHDSFRIATDRLHYMIQYVVIITTVGIFLSWLKDRGMLGNVTSTVLNFTWDIATFFVVPIIIVENINPTDAIILSSELLKKTWGEQIIGNISINFVFLIMIAVILAIDIPACIYLKSNYPYLALILAILSMFVILTLLVVQSALSEIFVVALYEYAVENTETDYFNQYQIREAFKKCNKKSGSNPG